MSLVEKINSGIKDAMRAKDKPTLEALRAVKAALLMELTKGGESELTEKVEMQILSKMHKQRKESAAIYNEQNRADLAVDEEFQAGVLEDFLPQQMTEAEIEATVTEIIASSGASGMKDMGKVMGQASGRMAGKADGKLIADIVKRILSA